MTETAAIEPQQQDLEPTHWLDLESSAIFDNLQEALDAVQLDEESIRSIRSKRGGGDGGAAEDDPASKEHELFLLMDSLVAELRADLQTQTVLEKNEYNPVPLKGLDELGLAPPSSRNDDIDHGDNTDTEQKTSDALFDLPVAGFTKRAQEGLTPTQQELLRRLRKHLERQQHTIDQSQTENGDRVEQDIPDFLESGESVDHFEKVETAAEGDDDFVPLADFTVTVAKPTPPATGPQPIRHIQNFFQRRREAAATARREQEQKQLDKVARGDVWKRLSAIVFRGNQQQKEEDENNNNDSDTTLDSAESAVAAEEPQKEEAAKC